MEYLLKSAAISTLFYLFYKIVINKGTYFSSIRWFLLAGLLLSLILPLITIPKYVETIPSSLANSTLVSEINGLTTATTYNEVMLSFEQILLIIYLIGIVFLLIQFLIQLISLTVLLQRNKPKRVNGFLIIETDQDISPFSFNRHHVYSSIRSLSMV